MTQNLAYLPKVCPPKQRCGYWVYGFYRDNVTMAKAHKNYKTYGVLYNYDAASKVCPTGWHLPSDDEWKILEYFMGMDKTELSKTGGRGKLSRSLRSIELWPSEYKDANKYGFNAIPSGYFIYDLNSFYDLGKACSYWAHEDAERKVWCRCLKYNSKKIERNYRLRPSGFSVPCVKNL